MWAGQKPLGVTEQQQAEFLSQAFGCLAADPYIGAAFWFGMQDIPSKYPGGHGLYRYDGSAKPSAAAFKAVARGVSPQQCGGVIDTTGPDIVIAKPTDGAKFVEMFPLDAKAVEGPGGVGVQKIEIYVDGKFSRSDGDGHAQMEYFWPSREWKNGSTHTLTIKAWDEADNSTSKSITVTKVKHLPKVHTSAALGFEQLDATTVRVTGQVTSAKAHAAAKLRGRAFVVFQKKVMRKNGRLKWKTKHRVAGKARKLITVTKKLTPGSWRVYLRYPGRKGFKKTRSKPIRFKIAAPV
jgi:hypothetical protein